MDFFLFAEPTVTPSYELLLSAVVLGMMTGFGWCMRRMLGAGGILENQNKVMSRVSSILEQQGASQDAHNTACEKSSAGIQRLHAAALEACDQVEEICKEHGIDVGGRVVRVREALRKDS
jgi:hypothetical protein